MNLRRIHAVMRKEILHILRDWRSLLMALAVPLVMLLLFGYALTLDVDRIPTLVYDQAGTPESRALIEAFNGSRYFEIAGHVNDYRVIESMIDRSEALLAVVIPTSFSQDLLSGNEAQVQLIIDGSDSNTASIALGYAGAVVQTHALELRTDAFNRKSGAELKPPVEPQIRVWYNHRLESKNYIVPGLIAVILMIISALLTSLTIAREWEMGTMEQLLSTPLRAPELLIGKMLAYFGLGLTDTLVAVGLGVFVFGVPLRGNPLFLIFTSCIFLVGALFWGILISSVARSQLLAYQMGMMTSFLPAFLLSGFVYAIENMPHAIQVLTYFVPARYFITILKGVFLKGIGIEILWAEVLFLMAFAVIVFLIATRKLRQKVA